jgi:two-component system sensor histidine kinase SenX3
VRARLRSRLEEQERLAARAATELDAARSEAQRLREVLEAVPLGVVFHDPESGEVFRNEKSSSPTDDMQADVLVTREVAQLMSGAATDTRHQTVELHGPPRRFLELTVKPLVSGGAVVLIEDASARRHLEQVRRDFVDNVSHELRTPIGALGVLAEALEGETDPAVITRLVSRMSGEVQRAHALIEDLLELSKIERTTPGERAPVDIAEAVSAAVQRVRPLAERSGVRVDVASVEAGVLVRANREELVSAVANLVDNAVKYSDEGSSVDVRVDVGATAGTVDIVVLDHGVGIPARDHDRIFERFYRVDRARDRRTGGSGLGLAIVRHVALNHGGEVLVSSVEGEGSTFTLRLPAGEGSAP